VAKKKIAINKKLQNKTKAVAKKKSGSKKKRRTKKKPVAKKKSGSKKKRRTKKNVVAKKKFGSKKKRQTKKKPAAKKKSGSKKKRQTKKKAIGKKKNQSTKKRTTNKIKSPYENKSTFKKKHKVFMDWEKLQPETIHLELFRQLNLPKIRREDLSRRNVYWVMDRFAAGTLTTVKPPYLFINVNVSLAPYAVRSFMDEFIEFFKELAQKNPGSEVIIHQEGLEPTIRSTPNPEDMDRNLFISLIARGEWPVLEDQVIPPSGPARDNELERLSIIGDQAARNFVTGATSSEELHLFVKSYDWSQRYKYLTELIENPACELNTALLIFWLSGADYFQREYKKRPAPELYGGYHRDAWDLVRQIKQNVKARKYSNYTISDEFKQEVVIVPEEQQLWKIDSILYGGVEKNRQVGKVAKKKGASKKNSAAGKKLKIKHACTSSKSQLQLHLDLLQGVTNSKVQYFLGTEQLVNGSSESHSELALCHVSEEVARCTYRYRALYFDSQNRLTEMCEYYDDVSLPDYEHSPRLQEAVEAGAHTYRKYELVQPYEFVPNKRGINLIGGCPPAEFRVPKLSSGLLLQYVGLLNQSDPVFRLSHDLHLVYPLYINFCMEVWIDYKNPLAPTVLNDKELSSLDWVDFKESDDIILEPVSFKTEPWPTKAKHGGHIGVPKWIQDPYIPVCPKTNKPMELICQLGAGELSPAEMKNSLISSKVKRTEDFGKFSFTDYVDWIPGDGDLFIFFHRKSRIACYFYQGT